MANIRFHLAKNCKPPFVLIQRIDGGFVIGRDIVAVASEESTTLMYDLGSNIEHRRGIEFSSNDMVLIAKEED